jgi:hypothetical protein
LSIVAPVEILRASSSGDSAVIVIVSETAAFIASSTVVLRLRLTISGGIDHGAEALEVAVELVGARIDADEPELPLRVADLDDGAPPPDSVSVTPGRGSPLSSLTEP